MYTLIATDGAFVTLRTYMHRVLADCRVSRIMCARVLRNSGREAL